ncbi:hypothetical protein BCR39DRAFT_504245 [Naematelia encephala]|uniref:Methyltransferase-domain-containing protein n=1 Tax=Naematelia encephala TaxID=71784 RepID=A0A1Y2BDE1_9TREE|nr:hypothetical protein BCR39DRAFT_504245 [Naematelia encephala]
MTTTTTSLTTYLTRLRRQHHSLYPPYLLSLPRNITAGDFASASSQRYLLDQILYDPITRSYEPELGYSRRFWRWIVGRLEQGVEEINLMDPGRDEEVDEKFYEALTRFMVDDKPSEDFLPKESYRTFIYNLSSWQIQSAQGGVVDQERYITLLEEQVAVQAGTTGLRTWTAALHLAHHILDDRNILQPDSDGTGNGSFPTIIELGAGTGFLSILLAQLGARVIATDLGDTEDFDHGIKRTPLARLRSNVELNQLQRPPHVIPLDWMDASKPPETWQELIQETPKTIVAADVIYDPDLIPALVTAVRVLLGSDRRNMAVFAATVRNPATLDLFCETCIERQLSVTPLNLAPMDDDDPTFWDSALDRGCLVRLFRLQLADHG